MDNLGQWCTSLDVSEVAVQTNFYAVDVEYSSAFTCILTGYLGIVYQRVHFKGQLFIDTFQFDSKQIQFLRWLGRLTVMFVIGGLLGIFFVYWLPGI